jgi:hypothetical protein
MIRMTAAALLVAGAVAGVGSSTAYAQAPACDSYSGACVDDTKKTKPPIKPSVLPLKRVRPAPDTLSVTGGELVLLLTVGSGAVAGGTALVVAGRRRKSVTA